MKEITVWYKLDGQDQPACVELREDRSTISDFKCAVKQEWSNKLKDVDAGTLRVFAAAVDANDPNSGNRELAPYQEILELGEHLPTTHTNALVVTIPSRQQAQAPSLPQRSSMLDYFTSHRENCGNKECVLCYIIYHSLSAADNNNNNNNINVPAEFKTQVTEATKRELQNYYYMALAEEGRRRRLPDISEVLSQALPNQMIRCWVSRRISRLR